MIKCVLILPQQLQLCARFSSTSAQPECWRTMSSFRLLLYLQPVDPGEAYQDMAAENDDVSVDVGVQFNASVMKGEQSLV